MSRDLFVSVLLIVAVVVSGCQEGVKSDPRYKVDASQVAVATGRGFLVPGGSEVDYVEQMATQRAEYRASLEALMSYYQGAGDAGKLEWARRELKALDLAPKYRYLMPAESAYADLRASESIRLADVIYEEAMDLYKAAGGLVVIRDEYKLRGALNKFNEVIEVYPTSDKIDDAAYRAGQIYDHFRDYEIAAVYYQRCFQWDSETPYPARFKAAYVLDKRLDMRKEALVLYQMSVESESRFIGNTEFAQARIEQLTRPVEEETESEPQE